MDFLFRPLRLAMDILINLFFWSYYTAGFMVFFLPVYIFGFLVMKDPQPLFQRLNHQFYRIFFSLSRILIPGLTIHIPPEVRDVKSSVIICNHISYIDPILLISLYPMHRTIVKGSIFRMPVFGWFLRHSGYIPDSVDDSDGLAMKDVITGLAEFLSKGGNLFVFPEGTRMPGGSIGSFHKGAFSLARKCRAPIVVLRIRNTDNLMKPGNLWYSTCFHNPVSVGFLARLDPDYGSPGFSLKGLIGQARSLYTEKPLTQKEV